MPVNGVLLVVTDAGTKHKSLEESIKEKAAEKNIKIFIAFYPNCQHRRYCQESLPAYTSVSDGRVFNLTDLDTDNFLDSLLFTVSNIYL